MAKTGTAFHSRDIRQNGGLFAQQRQRGQNKVRKENSNWGQGAAGVCDVTNRGSNESGPRVVTLGPHLGIEGYHSKRPSTALTSSKPAKTPDDFNQDGGGGTQAGGANGQPECGGGRPVGGELKKIGAKTKGKKLDFKKQTPSGGYKR